MRWLLVGLISACSYRQGVVIPRTEAGASCWRECKAIDVACRGKFAPGVNLDDSCYEEFKECALTCPGAREE